MIYFPSFKPTLVTSNVVLLPHLMGSVLYSFSVYTKGRCFTLEQYAAQPVATEPHMCYHCIVFYVLLIGITRILGYYMYTERISVVIVEGDIWRIRVPPPTHTRNQLNEKCAVVCLRVLHMWGCIMLSYISCSENIHRVLKNRKLDVVISIEKY